MHKSPPEMVSDGLSCSLRWLLAAIPGSEILNEPHNAKRKQDKVQDKIGHTRQHESAALMIYRHTEKSELVKVYYAEGIVESVFYHYIEDIAGVVVDGRRHQSSYQHVAEALEVVEVNSGKDDRGKDDSKGLSKVFLYDTHKAESEDHLFKKGR